MTGPLVTSAEPGPAQVAAILALAEACRDVDGVGVGHDILRD